MQVCGNLKYDVRAPKKSRAAELIRAATAGRRLIVAGSTVADRRGDKGVWEEALLMRIWPAIWEAVPDAVLVVAPRHPERFGRAWSVLEECGVVHATELVAGKKLQALEESRWQQGQRRRTAGRTTSVLLDTIGDLAAVYRLADVAFVGGSLVARGGHNPLEPAQFGVPVVMGSHFENFRDVVEKMQAADGIRIVQDEEDLQATLIELLQNAATARALGERGRQVFEREQGATARSLAALLPLVGAEASSEAQGVVSA